VTKTSQATGRSTSTAAFAGLGRRGELLARGWRAVDFDQEAFRVVESCGQGELSRPKSGRGRERHAQPADLGFPGSEGGYMDSSAPRRGYVAALKLAALRVLRFHDLRHTLGLAGGQLCLDRPGPGVDGPRRRRYDDALPGRQEPRRRRAVALPCLPR
jgi:integrase